MERETDIIMQRERERFMERETDIIMQRERERYNYAKREREIYGERERDIYGKRAREEEVCIVDKLIKTRACGKICNQQALTERHVCLHRNMYKSPRGSHMWTSGITTIR